MAVTIGNGRLVYGGAVVETSGGTKYAVFWDWFAAELEVWKDIDGVPARVDFDDYTTVWGAGIEFAIKPFISAAIDSADDIHIVTGCNYSTAGDRDVAYCIFDTGTDTLGAWEEAAAYTEQAPGAPGVAISLDSNDKPHVLFVDAVKVAGSTQDNVYYTDKTGAGWAAATQIGARAVKTDYYNGPDLTLCPADDVEAFYYFASAGDPAYRRKNAGWAGEAVYAETSAGIGFGGVLCTAGDVVYRYHADDDEDIEENNVDTAYNTDTTSKRVSAAFSPVDGTTRFVFYIDTSDDVHAISNDGGGWTDEGALQTGTFLYVIAEWAYNNENQDDEINYIFDDGTDVFYDSFSLVADVFPPVPGRVHRDRRSPLLRM